MVLEGAIGRGKAGEQDITIADAENILDDPTRARLHEKLDAKHAEDAARNRRIETVSAVLAGRVPATGNGDGDGKPDGGDVKDEDLRPGAPGWNEAVADHYASLADALETMDPDTRARFEGDYARAIGVLLDPADVEKVHDGLRVATADVVRRQVGSRRRRCPSISHGFTRPNTGLRPRCRPRSGCPP